jgi:antitoxin component YwqK of YwqJK toxin-antitoxin module
VRSDSTTLTHTAVQGECKSKERLDILSLRTKLPRINLTAMTMHTRLVLLFLLITTSVFAQQPRYTVKLIRASNDGTFKNVTPTTKNGKVVSYVKVNAILYDIDDDKSTSIRIEGPALFCFEATWKDGKKEGLVVTYVIDSLNREHRYKIGEQQYRNNRLHGEWREYTLAGTLHSVRTYQNDSIRGIARSYAIDGTTVVSEREYLGSFDHHVDHILYPDGKIERTITIQNGKRHGIARHYYPDGKLMEEVTFKNDNYDGTYKYFYPNGQSWIEIVYKDGLSWAVVSNFTQDGKRRDGGTLQNGNGTIIYYNDDGSVREVSRFSNGEEQ